MTGGFFVFIFLVQQMKEMHTYILMQIWFFLPQLPPEVWSAVSSCSHAKRLTNLSFIVTVQLWINKNCNPSSKTRLLCLTLQISLISAVSLCCRRTSIRLIHSFVKLKKKTNSIEVLCLDLVTCAPCFCSHCLKDGLRNNFQEFEH